jgi:hypothetical protein
VVIWWYTSLVPATWEADIRGPLSKTSLGKDQLKILAEKETKQNKTKNPKELEEGLKW